MPFSITQLPSADKLCRTLSWPLLDQLFPRQRIEQLTESICGQTTRARKLTLVLVIWVLICWHLYLRHSLGAVFLKLSSVERWLGEEEPESLPTRAAWTYRRKQLGVPTRRSCRATPPPRKKSRIEEDAPTPEIARKLRLRARPRD